MVRCRMRVHEIRFTMGTKEDPSGEKDARGYTKRVPCRMATIKASPTYSTDPNDVNKKFWEASPGGSFEINCVNEAAVEQLQLDKEYYFDISPVETA